MDRRNSINRANKKSGNNSRNGYFQTLGKTNNCPLVYGGGYFHKSVNSQPRYENFFMPSLVLNCRNVKINYRNSCTKPKTKERPKTFIRILITLHPRQKSTIIAHKTKYVKFDRGKAGRMKSARCSLG
eukprot:TRINITY_DN11639_c0_g1_i1.p1 TRINITY_DN11639_c0_g1~~TRINITY_DN11639_c0_g1_i1.p1  ORF type:complete len:128 (+),score=19.56 TRINITY_DN11639_c0_g1_i1:360-743(+)